MSRYQIEFKIKGGRIRHLYLDSQNSVGEIAAETATSFLKEQRQPSGLFHREFRPPRTLKVFEFVQDLKVKGKINKEEKFTLSYTAITYTFKNGNKERAEWYELNY